MCIFYSFSMSLNIMNSGRAKEFYKGTLYLGCTQKSVGWGGGRVVGWGMGKG